MSWCLSSDLNVLQDSKVLVRNMCNVLLLVEYNNAGGQGETQPG